MPRLTAPVLLLTALLLLTGCGASTTTAHFVTPHASGEADDGASPEGSAPPVPDDYLKRIPHFPPAPPAEPITLPAGASAAWLTHIPTT